MFKRLILLIPALALSACIVVIADDDADISRDDKHPIVNADSSVSKADFKLGNRIENMIHSDHELMNADVSVSNHGQDITLHGELFDASDLQRVIDIAMSDHEVRSVSSRIILNLTK